MDNTTQMHGEQDEAARGLEEPAARGARGPHLLIVVAGLLIVLLVFEIVEQGQRPVFDRRYLVDFAILGAAVLLLGWLVRDARRHREMQESVRVLAQVVQSSNDAIIALDLRGVVRSWNPGAARIYGYEAGEAVGRSIMLIVPPDLREELESALRRARRGERIDHFETVRRRKDGSLVGVSLRISPIAAASGAITGTSTIARDITERKRAEEALRRSEERYALAQRAANIGSWDWDIETGRLHWSEQIEAMFGFGQGEFDGSYESFLAALHPGDRDRVVAAVQACVERGQEYRVEHRIVRRDGTLRWLAETGDVIRDANGRAVRMLGVVTDVTDRRRMEEEREQALEAERRARLLLEASQRRLQFLADVNQEVASSLDYRATLARVTDLVVPGFADGCIISLREGDEVHRVACRHVDPAKEAVLQSLDTSYPIEESRETPSTRIFNSARTSVGGPVPDPLLRAMARDHRQYGQLLDLGIRSYLAVPLASRGRVLGAMFLIVTESDRLFNTVDVPFIEDVARRAAVAIDNARLFEETRQAHREAEEANRSKDDFLAVVSHELRTPLNAILGWAVMLRLDEPLDAANHARALEAIERNARIQRQLIDDLLDLSRIVSGKLRLEVGAVDLPAVIEAALDSVRPSAEAKRITLETAFDPAAGPTSGDPDRLQQVVWNLLSNAIKFTPSGGHVAVTLSRGDGHVTIAVSDTGQGIRPELVPYVFDRFRQGESGTTRRQGGLGLGLAIVRHLVELHGGRVSAESPGPGQGATFRVQLPPSPQPASEAQPLQAATAVERTSDGPRLDGVRVLAVDDEPEARVLMDAILGRAGAEVRLAASAGQAMHILEDWRPHVIVSDIAMPDEDGYSLIRRVRQRRDFIPAVAMTAYARSEDRVRVLGSGFQMHVAKPVEPAELVAIVASLAGKRTTG